MTDVDNNIYIDSNDTITIPISQTVNPIKLGMNINLDHLPVSITKDNITYEFEDYINILINKKLNAEVERNNPCSSCQEFDCTYCEYNHRGRADDLL